MQCMRMRDARDPGIFTAAAACCVAASEIAKPYFCFGSAIARAEPHRDVSPHVTKATGCDQFPKPLARKIKAIVHLISLYVAALFYHMRAMFLNAVPL